MFPYKKRMVMRSFHHHSLAFQTRCNLILLRDQCSTSPKGSRVSSRHSGRTERSEVRSVVRQAHHPALGHELGPNGATSKGNPGEGNHLTDFWVPARARCTGLGRNDKLQHSLFSSLHSPSSVSGYLSSAIACHGRRAAEGGQSYSGGWVRE
jgi:hypothetical protein